MSLLAILWFCLAALLLAVYAVLDGFDLGVGMIYGFMPKGEQRKATLAAISPVWNGNEVFLLAGVGAILAAFPLAYGALLSGMYIPVMLTLVGLIFRAVGIELRTKVKQAGLTALFDTFIVVGSLIPAWAIGVVAANVLLGFPIDASGYPVSDFLGYLNPFALLGGFVSIAVFVLHGLAWLGLKTSGPTRERVAGAFTGAWVAAFVLLAAGIAWAAFGVRPAGTLPALPGIVVALGGLAALLIAFRAGKPGAAFLASCLAIVGIVAAAAASLFPMVIPSRLDPAAAITVASAASSDSSLGVMLAIAAIGVPLVVVYVVVLYRTFRNRAA
jgi:cytochrome d ubiquinol oxidase subunit II